MAILGFTVVTNALRHALSMEEGSGRLPGCQSRSARGEAGRGREPPAERDVLAGRLVEL